MERNVKGFPISKAFTCMNFYENLSLQTKTAILSIWLYCCMSNLWFDSVCVTVTSWVNFREKHLHKHELQLSDYNV